MAQTLEQIEYRRGMLDAGMKPEDLPVKTWHGAKIPAEIKKAIYEENLLSLGGIYNFKDVVEPLEYEHLKMVLSDDVVEIEFFNRGFTLFATDDEDIRRIHRVFCKLARPPA